MSISDRLDQIEQLARDAERTASDASRAAAELRAEIAQLAAEQKALIVHYGDPEPDRPAGGRDFQAQGGSVWYRTLLDGWRWRGDCRFGRPWESIPEGFFPLRELVGSQKR